VKNNELLKAGLGSSERKSPVPILETTMTARVRRDGGVFGYACPLTCEYLFFTFSRLII